MATETLRLRPSEPVVQFSVFTANKLGRLHDLIQHFAEHHVHVLAITVLDTTDSAILRLIVDDPAKARSVLREDGFAFTESEVLVFEMDAVTQLHEALQVLLETEININYLYAFLARPGGKTTLALSLEDRELAESALARHQFRVLHQGEISR
ncbi:MAG: acetolactate synthase [Verrucomicrobia bacterium]|nr:acetolactate synthase [Verrucomicrobiota bacterium]